MRIVIAEDSGLLRESLARLLASEGLEVVASCVDGEDLVRRVAAHHPDLALVDVRLPPTFTDEGLRAARTIRAEHPGTAVLVLSRYVNATAAARLLADSPGSTGYLLKDRVADVATLVDAIRRVAGGGSALDPEIVAVLMGGRLDDPLADLTPAFGVVVHARQHHRSWASCLAGFRHRGEGARARVEP